LHLLSFELAHYAAARSATRSAQPQRLLHSVDGFSTTKWKAIAAAIAEIG
jgi:hypothetical protein